MRITVVLLVLTQLVAGCAAASGSNDNAATGAPGTFTAHLGAVSGFYVGSGLGR